jgi:hypothetical protein
MTDSSPAVTVYANDDTGTHTLEIGALGITGDLADLERLAETIRDKVRAFKPTAETELLAAVRASLAEHQTDEANRFESEPVAVIIGTDEWDNGYFYDTSVEVVLADGAVENLDLGGAQDVEDALGEIRATYGSVGEYNGILVDLRGDGSVDTDLYTGVPLTEVAGVTLQVEGK